MPAHAPQRRGWLPSAPPCSQSQYDDELDPVDTCDSTYMMQALSDVDASQPDAGLHGTLKREVYLMF